MGPQLSQNVLSPSEEESTLSAKNFFFWLQNEKSFPYRIEPFSEGGWCAEKQTESHESCFSCGKWQ